MEDQRRVAVYSLAARVRSVDVAHGNGAVCRWEPVECAAPFFGYTLRSMFSRRGLLKRILGGAPVAVVASHAALTSTRNDDDFTVNGIRVRWTGWKEPANQDVRFGAYVTGPEVTVTDGFYPRKVCIASTTLGLISEFPELGVFNTTAMDGWPFSLTLHTHDEFEAAKRRARVAIIDRLSRA